MNPLELASRYIAPPVMRRLVEVLIEEHGLRPRGGREEDRPLVDRVYEERERRVRARVKGSEEVESRIGELAGKAASGGIDAPKLEVEVAGTVAQAMAEGHFCGFHAKLDHRSRPETCSACRGLFRL